jgi:hypothetical protein
MNGIGARLSLSNTPGVVLLMSDAFSHAGPIWLSRTTVRKVVRSDRTAFKCAREVQPSPKLGDWMGPLKEIVEAEARLPKRERRSTQRLFEELRGRGYDGAHDSVHRFVKEWRDERARVQAQAFAPMSFAPGEAYQFAGDRSPQNRHRSPSSAARMHSPLRSRIAIRRRALPEDPGSPRPGRLDGAPWQSLRQCQG